MADRKPLESADYPIAEKRPGLLAYPLQDIPVPVLTLNQAWKLVEPKYHICAEQIHYHRDPAVYERFSRQRKLITIGGSWASGEWPAQGFNLKIRGVPANLPPNQFQEAIWSDDPREGVVICFGLCGTVSYSAIQIAAYMGFTRLWFLGLDLHGPKFTGEPAGKLDAQREQFRALAPSLGRRGLSVFVIGEDSRCEAFPRVSWPWKTGAGTP